MAGGVERLVDLLRVLAQRRRSARSIRRILRQREVLHHQGRRKSRLVAVVRRRGRHRARHRAIGRQRPALPRGGRGDVEQRLMRQAKLFRERKGLADTDHGNAEDHVVADLGRLPRTRPAAMHELLAHVFQHGFCRRKRLVLAAAHERQCRALGAAGSARHRRIDRKHAAFGSQRMRLLGAFDVDGRAIDDERPLGHRRDHFIPDREHMLARRQHGDDDFGALDGGNRSLRDISPVRLGLIARGRHQIERGDLVASLDQIGRHRPAHIAEANKCDICHLESSAWNFSVLIRETSVRRRRSRRNKARPLPASRPRF